MRASLIGVQRDENRPWDKPVFSPLFFLFFFFSGGLNFYFFVRLWMDTILHHLRDTRQS